jgi:uncharacterized protein
MTFNPNQPLDPGQVRDRRGLGGGAVAAGGGGIALVIALVYLLLGGNPADLAGIDPGVGTGTQPDNSTLQQECRTGADANKRQDCRIVGYVNSIQAFWSTEFQTLNEPYQEADTELFTGQVSTACGVASSQVGPFYCPADTTIYLDLGFFEELQTRFGAQGGPFAEAYVLAHEYGHHIQNLTGNLTPGPGQEGAEGRAVRTELQADCLSGVWANNAAETGYLQPLTADQIAQALSAAAAVGDDRIQQKTQGQVDPESWTHGSAEQRQRWFKTGYEGGTLANCDTFSGPI